MADSYDTALANPSSVPPLTRAIVEAQPRTLGGNAIGPTASDKSLRAIIDAVRNLEDRVIALGG
jgi:hypothetical protein